MLNQFKSKLFSSFYTHLALSILIHFSIYLFSFFESTQGLEELRNKEEAQKSLEEKENPKAEEEDLSGAVEAISIEIKNMLFVDFQNIVAGQLEEKEINSYWAHFIKDMKPLWMEEAKLLLTDPGTTLELEEKLKKWRNEILSRLQENKLKESYEKLVRSGLLEDLSNRLDRHIKYTLDTKKIAQKLKREKIDFSSNEKSKLKAQQMLKRLQLVSTKKWLEKEIEGPYRKGVEATLEKHVEELLQKKDLEKEKSDKTSKVLKSLSKKASQEVWSMAQAKLKRKKKFKKKKGTSSKVSAKKQNSKLKEKKLSEKKENQQEKQIASSVDLELKKFLKSKIKESSHHFKKTLNRRSSQFRRESKLSKRVQLLIQRQQRNEQSHLTHSDRRNIENLKKFALLHQHLSQQKKLDTKINKKNFKVEGQHKKRIRTLHKPIIPVTKYKPKKTKYVLSEGINRSEQVDKKASFKPKGSTISFAKIPFVGKKFKIDQSSDKWKEIPEFGRFKSSTKGTRTKLAWNYRGLYFAYWVDDPDGKISKVHADHFWTGDGVEIWIDPFNAKAPDRDYEVFWTNQFWLWPFGSKDSEKIIGGLVTMKHGHWKYHTYNRSDIQLVSKEIDRGWFMEFHIPIEKIDQLELTPGKVIGMNLSITTGENNFYWAGSSADNTAKHPNTWGDILLNGCDGKISLSGHNSDKNSLKSLIIGSKLNVRVKDLDMNVNFEKKDQVSVTIQSENGDVELLNLLETSPNSGIFKNTIQTVYNTESRKFGILELYSGEKINIVYLDQCRSNGSLQVKVKKSLRAAASVYRF